MNKEKNPDLKSNVSLLFEIQLHIRMFLSSIYPISPRGTCLIKCSEGTPMVVCLFRFNHSVDHLQLPALHSSDVKKICPVCELLIPP